MVDRNCFVKRRVTRLRDGRYTLDYVENIARSVSYFVFKILKGDLCQDLVYDSRLFDTG